MINTYEKGKQLAKRTFPCPQQPLRDVGWPLAAIMRVTTGAGAAGRF